MNDYAFDRQKIQDFDQQQHEIVHGDAIWKPLKLFELTDANVRYLWQTGLYFMGLVNKKIWPDNRYAVRHARFQGKVLKTPKQPTMESVLELSDFLSRRGFQSTVPEVVNELR
jgi:hypothetical protein